MRRADKWSPSYSSLIKFSRESAEFMVCTGLSAVSSVVEGGRYVGCRWLSDSGGRARPR